MAAGNSNLVYTVIRKRHVFHALANLPTDESTIQRSLTKRRGEPQVETPEESPAPPAPPPPTDNTLNASLADTPRLDKMTEKERAHPPGSETATPLEEQASSPEEPPCRRADWAPTPDWVQSWKHKLPLQTIMRLLQVLVPQVEKICIDKGLTDESEILKFLQHGTLVGLLPVPHPILIRKYQANAGTTMWFRTYMWGVIYLRNVDPPIWYDTEVRLFEIQRL